MTRCTKEISIWFRIITTHTFSCHLMLHKVVWVFTVSLTLYTFNVWFTRTYTLVCSFSWISVCTIWIMECIIMRNIFKIILIRDVIWYLNLLKWVYNIPVSFYTFALSCFITIKSNRNDTDLLINNWINLLETL